MNLRNAVLEAWLTFISFDEPGKIIELIEIYPEFKDMYGELYQFCLNIERVMGMFSKELLESDRNTVQYMIEEQEKELEALKAENEQLANNLMESNGEVLKAKSEAQEAESKRLKVEEENKQLKKILEELNVDLNISGK